MPLSARSRREEELGTLHRLEPSQALTWRREPFITGAPMFFFFSNRLGCLGSILVSVLLTLLLLLLFGVI